MRTTVIILLFAVFSLCARAADDPFAVFNAAMAGQDFTAKRSAIAGLVAAPKTQDDAVYAALVAALSDRQGQDDAIQALRGRSGLRPPAKKGASQYPGYPASDAAAAWQAWLAARKQDLDNRAKIANTEKLAKEAKETADKNAKKIAGKTDDKTDAVISETPVAAVTPGKPTWVPPPELGKADRIFLKNGGSLVCYIQSKRLDADGNLRSVRVVHEDGGEETLAADLIARIEEDVR